MVHHELWLSSEFGAVQIYGARGEYRLAKLPDGLFSVGFEHVLTQVWNMDGAASRVSTRPVRELRFSVQVKSTNVMGDLMRLLRAVNSPRLKLEAWDIDIDSDSDSVRTAELVVCDVSDPDFHGGSFEHVNFATVDFLAKMPYPYFVGEQVTQTVPYQAGNSLVDFRADTDNVLYPEIRFKSAVSGARIRLGDSDWFELPTLRANSVLKTAPFECGVFDDKGARVEGVVPFFPDGCKKFVNSTARILFEHSSDVDLQISYTSEWSFPW